MPKQTTTRKKKKEKKNKHIPAKKFKQTHTKFLKKVQFSPKKKKKTNCTLDTTPI